MLFCAGQEANKTFDIQVDQSLGFLDIVQITSDKYFKFIPKWSIFADVYVNVDKKMSHLTHLDIYIYIYICN